MVRMMMEHTDVKIMILANPIFLKSFVFFAGQLWVEFCQKCGSAGEVKLSWYYTNMQAALNHE